MYLIVFVGSVSVIVLTLSIAIVNLLLKDNKEPYLTLSYLTSTPYFAKLKPNTYNYYVATRP